MLTAAHCFAPSDTPGLLRAKAGATDIANQGKWTDIETIIVHKDFNPSTMENDIALVRLKSEPRGTPVALASKSTKIDVGQSLEVTGWGTTSEEGQGSRKLLMAEVPYVANSTCNEPASYNGAIGSGMICAGQREGGVDACQGDSGGPLVWRTDEGPVLVGVVSFGIGCARQLKYGIYTRVSDYRDWIAKNMAANSR